MKKIFVTIWHFLQNIFLFLLGFLFSFVPERKKMKRKSENFFKKDNSSSLMQKESSISTNFSSNEGNILAKTRKEQIDVDQEINKVIEEVFSISIASLSHTEIENLQFYKKKIVKKIPEILSMNSKEEVHALVEKEVKKQKEQKSISFISDNPFDKVEMKSSENLELSSIPLKELSRKDVNEAIPSFIAKESFIPDFQENSFEKKDVSSIPIPKEMPDVFLSPRIFSSLHEEEKLFLEEERKDVLEVTQLEENKLEQVPKKEDIYEIEDDIEKRENIAEDFKISDETVFKKENINIPIVKAEEKSDSEEKKKDVNPSLLEQNIPFSQFERDRSQIEKMMEEEKEKEEFVDKDYEKIESQIREKKEFLNKLLQKPLKEEQKIKLIRELQKIESLEKQVTHCKENDLENIRIALEEGISSEELFQIKNEFQNFLGLEEMEYQKSQVLEYSEEQSRELSKTLIKRTLRKTLKKLQMPLFLSFPFLKNKYFRRFVSGFFVFSGFSFIKNILFQKVEKEKFDFSSITNGMQAFEESFLLVNQNLQSLTELKELTFLKYPELKKDEEFLFFLREIEERLEKEKLRLQKESQMLQKNFKKSMRLVRKLDKNYYG